MNKLLMIVALFCISCSKPLELKGFDKESWLTGKNGCSSSRIEQLDFLKMNNDLFIGVNEGSITKTLGKADRRELVTRMGRKYYYFITPSTNCSSEGKENPPALIIEFEQRGIVKMIIVPSKKAILRN